MRTMHNMTRIAGLALLASLTVGCMITAAGLAPSTVPITSSSQYTVMSEDDTLGSAWGISVFGIPVSEASTKKAKRRAIEAAGADALIDVTTDNWVINLVFIPVDIFRIEVGGKPVKLNK